MSKIKIRTINVAAFILTFSFLAIIVLSICVNKLTPQYSVQSLKSAQITNLKNAYISTDSRLVGITTNRQQFKYVIPADFQLNTSGNVSVYTFDQDYQGNVALSKTEYEASLKQSQKLEQKRKPFSDFKKYSIITWIISTIIFIGAFIDFKAENKNSQKDEN